MMTQADDIVVTGMALGLLVFLFTYILVLVKGWDYEIKLFIMPVATFVRRMVNRPRKDYSVYP